MSYTPATHPVIFNTTDPAGYISVSSVIFIQAGNATGSNVGIIPTSNYVSAESFQLIPPSQMGYFAGTRGKISSLAVQFASVSPV